MSQPTGIGGRPFTPAPGMPTHELRIARLRGHARRLVWSALVLIALAGAVGYFWGNLPDPFTDVELAWAAGGILVLFVLLPYLRWWRHHYTVTTERVLEHRGVFRGRRTELLHARGYVIDVHRGLLQRMWGAGTLRLSDGVGTTLVMRNIPGVVLVHETLVDQVEVAQIVAHRGDAVG